MTPSQESTGRSGESLRLPILQLADPANGSLLRERRDAAAHRARILATAQALFAVRPIAAVTMEEIATAAGVGKGTLYRRYAHKGELCLALLGNNAQRFAAAIAQDAQDYPTDASALDLIRRFLQYLIAFNEENSALLREAVEAGMHTRRGWMYETPIYQWMRDTLRVLLRRAVADGTARALNPGITADLLLAPFAIDLYQYQREVLGLEPEAILTAASDLLLHGLCREA